MATAENELRRIRTLIEHAPDGIAVHRDGRFVFVNPALLRSLGYGNASELLGRAVLDLIHPDDRALATRRMVAIYQTGQPNPPEEHRILRRDGSIAVAEVAGVMIDWDGAPAVVTFGRDVSERKQLEAQLLLKDRLAALGTLCAGVAHEINNPLGYAIASLDREKGELDAIREELSCIAGTTQDADVRARLSALEVRLDELAASQALVREGTQQVRRIVADLRTLGREDVDQRGPVDVRWVLDAAVNLARYEVVRRARLTLAYEEVPIVRANAARLEQVFLNLLVNAAQAIPEGLSERHEIRIHTATTKHGWALIEVSDTGSGFSPEVARRLFDPFFTTKPPGEGVGLGLSICHRLVSELGGRIEVASEAGSGSTFRVVLPPFGPES